MSLSRHSRAMLLNVLWHHQGGSSRVGQPIRTALGIEQYARLSDEEIELYARSEIAQWRNQDKELASLSLQVDGQDVVIEAVERAPISRVRRITGYLSNVENFNGAKRAECGDRYRHCQ